MKVLVTGASGNVGRSVVKALLDMGSPVVAAGTNTKRLESMFDKRVHCVALDFQDKDTFPQALKDVDRVFLMRPPHLGRAEDLYPFIDAMKTAGIQLVSFLSLMGVEKNPFPPHHKIEKYIEASGLPYAHLRPGFFMQNVSGIHAEEIRKLDKVFVPAGNSRTSFIDADDIGLAAATLCHDHKKYMNTSHTITGGEALHYDDVARILSEVTGRQIAYAKPGFLQYRNHYIKVRSFSKEYVNVTVVLYLMTRLGTAKTVTDDFFRLTNRKPRSFREFALANRDAFTDCQEGGH